MSISDNIKAICKLNGTSMYKLEKEIGLGNGTIGKWGKNGRVPNYDTLSAVASALNVTVAELMGDELTGNEKAPASVSESGRPYVDLDTKMIWAPTPVSILAAQYDVPSPVLAEIVGCDADRASFMIFGTASPTDEELLRIAAAFCVTPDSLRKGWVPLTANQYVADDITRRKSNRIPRQEDPQS